MNLTFGLRNAILENDILRVALLLPQIQDINCRVLLGDEDHTPHTLTILMLAITLQHYEIAHMLLDNGASVDIYSMLTELTCTAESLDGVKELAERLMRSGANLSSIGHGHYPSPLHAAANGDKLDFVEFYLAHGANPNLEEHAGYTPIMFTYSPDVAEVLIRFGADPMYMTTYGFRLCDKLSCGLPETQIVMYLIKKGYPITDTKDGEFNLLQRSIVAGNTELSIYLLEHGVSTTYKVDGKNAYDVAVQCGRSSLIKVLDNYPK